MSVPVNRITKTIKLAPGESFIFPADADIVYTSDSNAIVSECIDIPSSGQAVCTVFKWAVERDEGGGSGPWRVDNGDCRMTKLVVGGNIEIPLNDPFAPTQSLIGDGHPYSNVLNDTELYKILKYNPTLPGEIVRHKFIREVSERYEWELVLKLPQNLVDTSYIMFTAAGFENTRIYATACADCCE